MFAICQGLTSGPKTLLLDEPSMGLVPVIVQEIRRIIMEMSQRGVPVVLIEQNAEPALRPAVFACVLEVGTVAPEGQADDLHEYDHVRRACLGG